jgi:hypothetical protein
MSRALHLITVIFLFLLWISPFASAVFVLYMWRLISLTEVEVKHCWRKAVLRVAQVGVTVAVVLTWYWLFNHGGLTWPAEDRRQGRFFRTSGILAFCSLAGSILGAGAGRKATAASSILVMVNWLAVGAFS